MTMTFGMPHLGRRFGAPTLAILIGLGGFATAGSGVSAEESSTVTEDAACTTSVGGQEELMELPEGVRPMTAVELHALYANESWRWCNGAGYMQDEGRVFKGWSGSGDDATWALGRWTVTDTGRMCLKAEWHNQSGTYNDDTCFRHMTDGQTIYQRKEPSGSWYVFRHAEPLESDEFAKLVSEDLVSEKLETLRN